MNEIPSEIYERVHEFAIGMANATEAGDQTLHDAYYQSLLSYYQEQHRLGQSHPFLTEALADSTTDARMAVRYYQQALRESADFPAEPRYTKMISLAQRLIDLRQVEQAEAFLRDGRSEAARKNDDYWVREADRITRELEM